MLNPKNTSVGQIIRRIHAKEIAQVYTLYGGDAFLEDFIIKELTQSYLAASGNKILFSMDQDSEEVLFRELSAISLFEENRIIIVREIKKLKSNSGRKELIQYLQSPNTNLVLVLISEEFDIRTAFLKNISDNSQFLDIRPPFQNEMKQWISHVIKAENIQISESLLDQYIDNYGDSIAHVINEIEKSNLMLGDGVEINESNLSKLNGHGRVFQIWHLQDSLGKKDLQKSLAITKSLLENGTPSPRLIVGIASLYQQMLWKKMGRTRPIGYTGINKIITNNLNQYDPLYTDNEINQLIMELGKLDILSKSTSLGAEAHFYPLLVRICQGGGQYD